MLRQWHRPSHTSYLAEEVIREDDNEDIPLWDGGESDTQPVIKNSVEGELGKLLKEFSDVLKNVVVQPSHNTSLRLVLSFQSVSHRIYYHTQRGSSKRARTDGSRTIFERVGLTNHAGDNSLRLHVDYRKLNGLTLGLTKGYWQVPLKPGAQQHL